MVVSRSVSRANDAEEFAKISAVAKRLCSEGGLKRPKNRPSGRPKKRKVDESAMQESPSGTMTGLHRVSSKRSAPTGPAVDDYAGLEQGKLKVSLGSVLPSAPLLLSDRNRTDRYGLDRSGATPLPKLTPEEFHPPLLGVNYDDTGYYPHTSHTDTSNTERPKFEPPHGFSMVGFKGGPVSPTRAQLRAGRLHAGASPGPLRPDRTGGAGGGRVPITRRLPLPSIARRGKFDPASAYRYGTEGALQRSAFVAVLDASSKAAVEWAKEPVKEEDQVEVPPDPATELMTGAQLEAKHRKELQDIINKRPKFQRQAKKEEISLHDQLTGAHGSSGVSTFGNVLELGLEVSGTMYLNPTGSAATVVGGGDGGGALAAPGQVQASPAAPGPPGAGGGGAGGATLVNSASALLASMGGERAARANRERESGRVAIMALISRAQEEDAAGDEGGDPLPGGALREGSVENR